MTDSTRGTGAAPGPPWSVDVLADLHAGALDARQSAALWAQVNQDPEAQAVLAALDEVKRDLDSFGDAPVEPMPAHFAAQLDAAIAAEAARSNPVPQPAGVAPVSNVTDMAEARRKRSKRMGWAAGVLTAAAAAVAVTFVSLPGEETGTPQAGNNMNSSSEEAPGATPPLALTGQNLGPAINGLQNHEDYGPFEDEAEFRACLTDLAKIDDPEVIGVREVTLDGREGVAGLLARGEDGKRFRLVIVDPECTTVITDTSLG